jgi:hypothetical protein
MRGPAPARYETARTIVCSLSTAEEATMVPLTALWLPILLSAILVFVASSILHMFLPYHWNDFARVPEEDRVLATLRKAAIRPGEYMLPHAASPKAMNDPAFMAKTKEGTNFLLTVTPPGPASMTRNLVLWFLYCVVISWVAAYLGGRTTPAGSDYLAVFRVTGTTAFAAFALGLWQQSIWYAHAWSTTLKSTFDGLVYALLVGGVFGWLWP